MRNKGIYAMYKGDEFLCIGTVDEIARKRNIKPSTVSYYATASYEKRVEKYKSPIIVIKIDD